MFAGPPLEWITIFRNIIFCYVKIISMSTSQYLLRHAGCAEEPKRYIMLRNVNKLLRINPNSPYLVRFRSRPYRRIRIPHATTLPIAKERRYTIDIVICTSCWQFSKTTCSPDQYCQCRDLLSEGMIEIIDPVRELWESQWVQDSLTFDDEIVNLVKRQLIYSYL